MDTTHQAPTAGGMTTRDDIGSEHPVGAGFDRKGHRDSSVERAHRPHRHSMPWVLGLVVAFLAAGVIIARLLGR